MPLEQAPGSTPRKSLEQLGLVLPFSVWLALVSAYLAAAGVLYFVPSSQAPFTRTVALGVALFIAGIFSSFKLPLWVQKND